MLVDHSGLISGRRAMFSFQISLAMESTVSRGKAFDSDSISQNTNAKE
jgi:hypothetical protein